MNTTRIRIGLWSDAAPTPPDDDHHYWAEAIEDGNKFYYRVNGTTVEITEGEFLKVVADPVLYYFSTALKLHLRIKRELESP